MDNLEVQRGDTTKEKQKRGWEIGLEKCVFLEAFHYLKLGDAKGSISIFFFNEVFMTRSKS